METLDIQFYGERGILNGILLDMYHDENTYKGKLKKFFGAIRLFSGDKVPWGDITGCKWMIEPSFAHFGDPDLIAVFESDRKKYALFIEAKLKDYISSCMSLEREDGITNLKGQSSKLNVQLSFRYRFVQAFKEAIAKEAKAPNESQAQEITESSHKYPDGKIRKLYKESVVRGVRDFLEGVDEYYFIALTNDVSSQTVIQEIKRNGKYYPPLINGTYNGFNENKSKFGVLTYRELVNKKVVTYNATAGERLGFFGKACKMMGVEVQSCKEDKMPSVKGENIKNWKPDLRKLADDFQDGLDLQLLKREGSYSLELDGEVVMKLMQYQDNKFQDNTEKRLGLGLLDTSVFNVKEWKEQMPKAFSVGFGGSEKTFYFYDIEEDNIEEMIELARKYCNSLLGTPEPIEVWQDIPKKGICGTLSGLQYNTGLWTNQGTTDSDEDPQEPNSTTQPYDELRLLIKVGKVRKVGKELKEVEGIIEVLMENLSTLSLHTLGSPQKDKSQPVMIKARKGESDRCELYISPKKEENTPEIYQLIASSQWMRWRYIE